MFKEIMKDKFYVLCKIRSQIKEEKALVLSFLILLLMDGRIWPSLILERKTICILFEKKQP